MSSNRRRALCLTRTWQPAFFAYWLCGRLLAANPGRAERKGSGGHAYSGRLRRELLGMLGTAATFTALLLCTSFAVSPAHIRAAPAPAAIPAPSPAPAAQTPIPWNTKTQGQFITCLLQDGKKLWLGTEDQGAWEYDPEASTPWKQFTTDSGLGDNDVYALARGRMGRIWAGHLSHGVSVFNGVSWRNYSVPEGPIGNRIYDIACSPLDNDVWIATEAGISRYSLKTDRWSCFTRLDGLPSDAARALAFNRSGKLFVGTQCDGIAIAGPGDGYRSWRLVPGPARLPPADAGKGIPCRFINCMLCSQRSESVFAGTPWGLARSDDAGKTWRYLRGADWEAKVKGLWHGPAPVKTLSPDKLLLEDYVTSLAETDNGLLVIGFRQAGYEIMDPAHDQRLRRGTADYAFSMQVTPAHQLLIGSYGSGLQQAALSESLFRGP